MKKIIYFFVFVILIGTLGGCGVKNALEKPDANYPRNYPVY